MENGKQMAFPGQLVNGEVHTGLTKREYFAVHIATGLSVQAIAGSHNCIQMMEIDVPLSAVRIADALLKALETKSE
jgi:hypothetical protein